MTGVGHGGGRPAGRAPGLLRRAGGVVVGYHDVVADGADVPPLAVTARQLRGHIRLLRRLGFAIIPVRAVVDRVVAGAPTDGLAALVFDDALLGVHRHGIDVLLAERAPAAVAPVTGHLGIPPPWWPGAERTMDHSELLAVLDAGLDLVAHTRTHPSLPALSAAGLASELGGARDELQQLTGRPVDLLAYPYGHHNPAVVDAAEEAGFRAGFTFLNGRLTGAEHPFRLPRLTAGPHLGLARLAYHLARPARSWPDTQRPEVRGETARR